MELHRRLWPRAIILVDMNAFFASVEQRDNPELRGKPIAVTNGAQGSCIITCSYEARSYGIKTGMRLKEAKKLCPFLIQAPTHPEKYVEVSTQIMEALHTITPDIEIFSIDEAFLDITHCQRLYASPTAAAERVKQIVTAVSGLPCSVGLSGDKTTAKYAAESKKPNGFTVILPWEAEQILAPVPVTALCGIGENIAKFLAQYDVTHCGDMKKIPISILGKRFGNLGRRMWLMCQGKDPEPIHATIAPAKSLGHGKVLPPKTKDIETLKIYFRHMAEKVAARLRRHNMYASQFFIGMRTQNWSWLGWKYKTPYETQTGTDIYAGCKLLLEQYPQPGTVAQVQVTALNPKAELHQLDLFEPQKTHHQKILDHAIDNINEKFGDFTIMPATLMQRTTMPNVIAPAWRPSGIRKTV
jgi:DNA polymerase IV